MDRTQEFIDETTAYQDSQSSGSKFIASTEAFKSQQLREEQDKKADEVWKAQPVKPPYRHRDAFASGETDLTKDLPNKFLEPATVDVAGHDLSTGKKVYQALPFMDTRGMPREGIEALSRSMQTPGKPSPSDDIAAIAKIGLPCVQAGCNFDEFNKFIPPSWNEQQKKTAWNAAKDAFRMKQLENDIEQNYNSALIRPAPENAPTVEMLKTDKGFASSARVIYQAFEQRQFGGSDSDASEWLTSHLRWFDIHSAQQARVVTRIKNGSSTLLKAYEMAFNTWETVSTDWSVGNVLANAGRAIVDPANLLGLSAGKVLVSTAGRLAAKRLISSMLAKGASKSSVAGALVREGAKAVAPRAALGGGADAITSAEHTVATGQVTGQPPSSGQVAASAGIGALLGAGLTTLIPEGATLGAQYGLKASKWFGQRLKETDWSSSAAGSRAAQRGSVDLRPPDAVMPSYSFDEATGFFNPVARAIEMSNKESLTPVEAANIIKSYEHYSPEMTARSGILQYLNEMPQDQKFDKGDILSLTSFAPHLAVTKLSKKPLQASYFDLMVGHDPAIENSFRKLHNAFDDLSRAQTAAEQGTWEQKTGLRATVELMEDRLSAEKADLVSRLDDNNFWDAIQGRPAQPGIARDKLDFLASLGLIPSSYGFSKLLKTSRSFRALTAPYAASTLNEEGSKVAAAYRTYTFVNPEGARLPATANHFDFLSGQNAFARVTDRAWPPTAELSAPLAPTKSGSMFFVEESQSDVHQAAARYLAAMRTERGMSPAEATDEALQAAWQGWSQNVPNAPVHYRDASMADFQDFTSDAAFWRTNVYTLTPEPFRETYFQNTLRSMLYQSAKDGNAAFGWAGPEMIRARSGGKGHTSNTLEVRFEDVPRSKSLTFVDLPAGTFRGVVPITFRDLEEELKKAGNSAAKIEQIWQKVKGSPVKDLRKFVRIDLGEDVVFAKPSFNEYRREKEGFAKFVKRYDSHAVVKEGKARVISRGPEDGTYFYVEMTPRLREKLLKQGVPLKKLAPVAIGTSALAGGMQTEDAGAQE